LREHLVCFNGLFVVTIHSLRLGNKYVYSIPLEVAILQVFFIKKTCKIATSKKQYQSYLYKELITK